MKKIFCLLLLLFVPFVFIACTNNSDCEIIQSTEFTINKDSLSLVVPNSTSQYSFINKFVISKNAHYSIYYDINCKNEIPSKTTNLKIGNNTFYILIIAENKKDINLYTATIKRNAMITITFNTNTIDTIDNQIIEEGCYATIPTTLINKTGYTFTKWDFNFSSPIIADKTINAIWTANQYNINYNSNGGELEENTQQVTYDNHFVLKTPTKKGYTFNGWYENTNKIEDGIYNFDKDLNLIANWRINSYSIYLEKNYKNAGNVNEIQNSYNYSSNVNLVSTSNQGYSWLGWYDKETQQLLSNAQTFSYNVTDKNVIIIAKWKINTYNISTANELKNITLLFCYYNLINDIDLNNEEWQPIGNENNKFTGVFNGDGHTISNLKITSNSNAYLGLFGYSKGTINNLCVKGNISTTNSLQTTYAGGLVGLNYGNIQNCSSNIEINVNSIIGYHTFAGGIVGVCSGGNIINCYSIGSVIATTRGYYSYSGGICSQASGSTIENCYSTCSVVAKRTDTSYMANILVVAGGIVGYICNTTIQNCFAIGNVEVFWLLDFVRIGGLVGYCYNNDFVNNEITNCYYSSSQNLTINNKNYNGEMYGISTSIENFYNETFLTNTLLFKKFLNIQNLETYLNSVWKFGTNNLPKLYWEE